MTERGLLVVVGAVAVCGILAVDFANGKIEYFLPLVVLGLILFAGILQFSLKKLGQNGDPVFLPLATMLVVLGLIMVYRLKPELFITQTIWAALGFSAFFLSALLFRHYKFWADYKYFWGALGVFLLIVTAVFGTEINGHKSWLILGPIHIQPAEFAKLFVVLFLAGYLDERKEVLTFATKNYGPLSVPHPRFLAPLLTVWGITMVILVLQRDLGSALFYYGTALTLTYMASGRKSFILWGLFLFVIGAAATYYMFDHVRVRFDIWLDPWSDPNGKAYQIVQSLFAFGSGGILGSGLTYGFPGLIPEVHTDFVFAAIGEELGLFGSGAVIFIYIILVARAFKTALTANKSYDVLLAGGLAVMLALQIFVIIGGVTKFLPLTGVTLPFVSYGGSSMVSTFIMLGALFTMSETRVADG